MASTYPGVEPWMKLGEDGKQPYTLNPRGAAQEAEQGCQKAE